jgi:N-acetylmuramoyl-L-alanine amidase
MGHRVALRRSATFAVIATFAIGAAAGCQASGPSTPSPTRTARTTAPSTPAPTVSSTQPSPTARPSTSTSTSTGAHPVIVIDPGHSPAISAIDPATGLDVSDYENEPEMRDVFAVALLVKSKLQAAGYRVIMTKNSVTQRLSLAQRAAIANDAHAALALSIHDQAGPNGGIGFDQGNNIVYYQAVGDYRATPSGHRVVLTDPHLAALSRTYGQIFQAERARAQGHPITLQSNVGYDLGTRGLAAGNIWLVQLLSRVPWVYNEAGGNSTGRSGLSAADERAYAAGLVAAVEHCVPPPP